MTLTRRTALAAPALLALPSAALARQGEPDPAVAAFHDWSDAFTTYVRNCRLDAEDPAIDAMLNAEVCGLERLATIQPTTAEGLRLQLLAGIYAMGEPERGFPERPLDWRPEHFGRSGYRIEDAGRDLMWSAMASLDRLAARGA